MGKIAIVTDSTSDIPADLARQHAVQVIPTVMVIENKSYIDGVDITREEFYQRQAATRTPITSAAPGAGVFEEAYRQAFAAGADEVISIHASSKLSSLVNTAQLAAREFDGQVHVWDSLIISLGTGYQVLLAAEAARRGAEAAEILGRLENVRPRARVVAMIDSLEYLRRSGRVNWATAQLGAFLKIKQFLELKDGVVQNAGQTRTRQNGIERLKELLRKEGAFERLAIVHSLGEPDARRFLAEIGSLAPPDTLVVNITPVIGVHVGPNALGFAGIVL
jgi:DegV family protein with EDD domain